MSNINYTVLALNDPPIMYSSETYSNGGVIGDLIKDLTFENEDIIDVYVDGDVLLDVHFNQNSLGYFFVDTLCEVYGFSKPVIIYRGTCLTSVLDIYIETEYTVPTFGVF